MGRDYLDQTLHLGSYLFNSTWANRKIINKKYKEYRRLKRLTFPNAQIEDEDEGWDWVNSCGLEWVFTLRYVESLFSFFFSRADAKIKQSVM